MRLFHKNLRAPWFYVIVEGRWKMVDKHFEEDLLAILRTTGLEPFPPLESLWNEEEKVLGIRQV